MSRIIVVSFENKLVNVIFAARTKKSFVIEDLLTLTENDFDDFLRHEKTKEFIVVSSFDDFFSDTFHIPPAKDKFIKIIIEKEIRKRSRLNDFSFIYTMLGEVVVEKKRMKEVFVFAVDKEYIRAIVDKFKVYGKVVKALYPDIFAVASFIGAGQEPVMGVMETGTNKNLFLVKEDKIQFVRIVQAFERGIKDHDIQNISMTVNYCRQTMKMNLQKILLLGNLCRNFDVQVNVGIPLTSFTHPVFSQKIKNKNIGPDFVSPIAALFVTRNLGIDILLKEDKIIFQTESVLQYLMLIFLVVMAYVFFQLGFVAKEVFELKREIGSIRKNLTGVEKTIEKYQNKTEEFSRYRPFLQSYRNYANIPDVHRLLIHLSDLSVGNIKLDAIDVSNVYGRKVDLQTTDEKKYYVTLKGKVDADQYASMQKYYQAFLKSVENIENLHIAERALNLETKSFQVEVIY